MPILRGLMATTTETTNTDNTFYFDKSYRDFNAYSQRAKFATIYRVQSFLGFAVFIFGAALVMLFVGLALLDSGLNSDTISSISTQSASPEERLANMHPSTLLLIFAAIVLGGLGVIFSVQEFVRAPFAYLRYREITHYGVLLDGEITESRSTHRSELVYVKYRFVTPTFETLTKEQSIGIGYVKNFGQEYSMEVIKPGTPIKVLYANRRNFVAL